MHRVLAALLALTLLVSLPLAPAFADDFDDADAGGAYKGEPESQHLRSAEDDIGDWFPTTLTGLADVMILRPTIFLMGAIVTAAYVPAAGTIYVLSVGPAALFGGDEAVSDLGANFLGDYGRAVVDMPRFVFTRRVGGDIEDRLGERIAY